MREMERERTAEIPGSERKGNRKGSRKGGALRYQTHRRNLRIRKYQTERKHWCMRNIKAPGSRILTRSCTYEIRKNAILYKEDICIFRARYITTGEAEPAQIMHKS